MDHFMINRVSLFTNKKTTIFCPLLIYVQITHSTKPSMYCLNTYVQGCQMVCFETKNPKLGKFFRALDWKMFFWPFGLFYGNLGYFMCIWYILYSFGTFFPVLVSCTKKNLATLPTCRHFSIQFSEAHPIPPFVGQLFSSFQFPTKINKKTIKWMAFANGRTRASNPGVCIYSYCTSIVES
jgi:hypothetical protein